MKKWTAILLVSLFLSGPGAKLIFADDASAPASDGSQQIIQDLEQKIDAQQKMLDELKARLETLEAQNKNAQKTAPAAAVTNARLGVNLKMYGYLEATGLSDTNPLFPDSLAGPFWALSPNDPAFKHQTSGSTEFTAQYSRLGLAVSAPETRGGWKPTGKLEMDFNGSLTNSPFQDAFSRSQMIPRLRLANVNFNKNNWNLEIGQDWEAIRQNVPYVFTSEDPFLDGGDVGYRRPLVRAAYLPKYGLQAMADAGLMDALSNADLDSSSGGIFRSGPMSTRPLYELRLGYAWKSSTDSPFTVSIWGARGWEKLTAGTILGLDQFNLKLIGADFTAPITDWFTVKGKAWTGNNLADVRGGIGQGVNTSTGQEIGARGGWLQTGFKVGPHYWVWIGDSVDNPFYDDLNNAPAQFAGSNGYPNARARNSFLSLTQVWSLGPQTDIGLEYFYHNTYFKNAPTGVDSRVEFSARQYF